MTTQPMIVLSLGTIAVDPALYHLFQAAMVGSVRMETTHAVGQYDHRDAVTHGVVIKLAPRRMDVLVCPISEAIEKAGDNRAARIESYGDEWEEYV